MGESGISVIGIVIIAAIILVVIIGAILMISQARKRTREATIQAQMLGFSVLQKPDRALQQRLKRLYRYSQQVRASDIATQTQGEAQIYICDISSKDTSADADEIEYRSVVIISPRLSLPFFMLVCRMPKLGPLGDVINQLIAKRAGMVGMSEVEFNDSPEFTERYMLFSDNHAAVQTAFQERVRSRLAQTSNIIAHGEGDMLVFNSFDVRLGARTSANKLAEHLKQARRFYDWLCF